jgi:di/tricarboxylate transporter
VVVPGLAPVAHNFFAGLSTSAPWWTLLFSGCYGGNMTMIGSTDNIVALGMLEKKTGHLIKFGYWLKVSLLASLIPMVIGIGAIMILAKSHCGGGRLIISNENFRCFQPEFMGDLSICCLMHNI